MPIIQSAIKRDRQQKVRQARLLPFKTHMKTTIRKVNDAVKAGKKEDLQTLLSRAFKAIDTAAKKGIIHDRNAARKKSSLSKKVSGAAK